MTRGSSFTLFDTRHLFESAIYPDVMSDKLFLFTWSPHLSANEISRGVQRLNAFGGFSLYRPMSLFPLKMIYTHTPPPLPPGSLTCSSHSQSFKAIIKAGRRHAGQAFEISQVCLIKRETNRIYKYK